MKTIHTLFTIGILFLSVTSCKPTVVIEDDKGGETKFQVENVTLTSSEIENEKEKRILEKINKFIETDKSDAVLNYLFLCDSSMISINKNYDVKHKRSNIKIGMDKKDVRITPIPSSYNVDEGPIATYKIYNDSLGRLDSYFLDLELDENFNVTAFQGTLRFAKKKDGKNKVTFIKEIYPEDNYLLEEMIKKNRW